MNKSTIILGMLVISLLGQAGHVCAQEVISLEGIHMEQSCEGICVKPLHSESTVSTFIIWIEDEVAEHYHQSHTEVVMVLEGLGELYLDGEKLQIKSGDYIFIPQGTKHAVKVIDGSILKVISIQTPQFDGSDRVLIDQY